MPADLFDRHLLERGQGPGAAIIPTPDNGPPRVAARIQPVGHTGVFQRDHGPKFAVRIDACLESVQAGEPVVDLERIEQSIGELHVPVRTLFRKLRLEDQGFAGREFEYAAPISLRFDTGPILASAELEAI